jgi:hypothetical protein
MISPIYLFCIGLFGFRLATFTLAGSPPRYTVLPNQPNSSSIGFPVHRSIVKSATNFTKLTQLTGMPCKGTWKGLQ